jgi:hypothetical protein
VERLAPPQDTVTDEDLRTGIAHAEYHVTLEVDQIDLAARAGWTVLVRGVAIIWTPRLSARRSSAPEWSRGSRANPSTPSG